MRVKAESDLLDITVRKKLIEEIKGSENRARKAKAYKRYRCYKDATWEYVVENLLNQFEQKTVFEMRYAISNISIIRKIIDKLARVYSNGVERTGKDEATTQKLQELSKVLNLQTVMKKTNRYLKLQKNLALFAKPCPVRDLNGNLTKWDLKPEVLQPFHYDVVEDPEDRTRPLAYILSDYEPESMPSVLFDQAPRGGNLAALTSPTTLGGGDNKDQAIADAAVDQRMENQERFVFWSKHLHFTCDAQGGIISNEDNQKNLNPFSVNPIINFSLDQDGAFYAEGGDDLIDGGILVNSMISHVNHVGVTQGYGILYMTGENLPTSVVLGPNKMIRAEYKLDEQAKPEFGFITANPQLDSLKNLIEVYIALLLTTNNLSTSGVSTQLAAGSNLASGIAMIIDKSESLEDVQDQQQTFIDGEREFFIAVNAIIRKLSINLDDKLKALELPMGFEKDLGTKFHDSQTIMSESEKLANMKTRKELGIDSMVSLLMKDDPTLSEDEAEKKLKKIIAQRIQEKMLEAQGGIDADKDAAPVEGETDKPADDKEAPVLNGPDDVAPVAGEQAAPGTNVQQMSLNGAQVTAMVDIVTKIAAGEMPREAGVQIIATSFQISLPDAEAIIGTAGKGFEVTKPEPLPQVTPIKAKGKPDESKQDDDIKE